jgi:hypothetical protein
MGFIDNLADLDEKLAETGDFADREKAVWVSLKNDGDSVKVTPLQEFDPGSPNYSAKNGVARTYLEHSNPDHFQWQAECTADEGSCYGCEQGWWQKRVLYINVLVDDGKTEPYPAILSRAFSTKGSIANDLRAIAADEDFDNSITDKTFKLTRNGTGKKTSYSLQQLPKAKKVNVEDYDLWDLSQAVFHVDPEKQERYYTTGKIKSDGDDAQEQPERKVATAAAVDVDW